MSREQLSLRKSPAQTRFYQAGVVDGARGVEMSREQLSLRKSPAQTRFYQAGVVDGAGSVDVKADVVVKDEEDSIENDAYVILMSYPEGRQKLQERKLLAERKLRSSQIDSECELNVEESDDSDISEDNNPEPKTSSTTRVRTSSKKSKKSTKGKTRQVGTRRSSRLDEYHNRNEYNDREAGDVVSTECKRTCADSCVNRKDGNYKKCQTSSNDQDIDTDSMASQMIPLGSLLWCKFGKHWFPAIKITGPMAGQTEAGPSHVWVMWFSDYKISKVLQYQAVCFGRHFKTYYDEKLSGRHEKAVIEALKICSDRCGLNINNDKQIKQWIHQDSGLYHHIDNCESECDPFKPVAGEELPVHVVKELAILRNQMQELSNESRSDARPRCRPFLARSLPNIDVTKPGYCMCCLKKRSDIACEHPIYEGFVCISCKEFVLQNLMAMDSDGCYKYCTVCTEGGSLYVCEHRDCGRSYCTPCLNRYLSDKSLLELQNPTPWYCPLCSDDVETTLRPRLDWRDRLVEFYNPMSKTLKVNTLASTGKINVLSFNDGIGPVMVALKALGLDIGKYLTTEGSIYAHRVQHYSVDKWIQEISSVTDKMVEEFCPLNLVVGRIPVKELKDLDPNSTDSSVKDILKMFSLVQYLNDLHTKNKWRPFYWVVEGSVTMKSVARKKISEILKVEPYMWDASFLTPFISPKFYWGNLPGLSSGVQCYQENKNHQKELQDYLTAIPTRQALVTTLRDASFGYIERSKIPKAQRDAECSKPFHPAIYNIDWNGVYDDILLHHFDQENVICYDDIIPCFETPVMTDIEDDVVKGTVHNFPVLMAGKKSSIWTSEVERVLGFPSGYTDHHHLTIAQRFHLLRDTTSVCVWREILKPLRDVFVTK